jgi:membrane fusion protein (multidrug efflux system)
VLKNALLVPQRAVSELQGATQLRVVGADDKVVLRTVKLGARVGSRVIVSEGLEANARVIVDAPQIRAGAIVKTKPYQEPPEAVASSRDGVRPDGAGAGQISSGSPPPASARPGAAPAATPSGAAQPKPAEGR